ncbi:dihydrolipoamide acetyltransferase family protein [Streptomyces sp. enrichment culture]|uniref:dihydrolipoamide acetyltransferase family protein n=1 Tax=Streptomyces sp. enrichment culture TaxID=1795815 RepID=UPI003F572A0B
MAHASEGKGLEFRLPDLGEGLTEAEIVRWLVEVGDVVAVDQPVVEVETAKAMVEVPCPYGGVVTARFGEEGTELPVGAPLVTVAVGAGDGGSVHDGTGDGTGDGMGDGGVGGAPAADRPARDPGTGDTAARTPRADTPDGASPNGAAPGGASPNGAAPGGAAPGGRTVRGDVPAGDVPARDLQVAESSARGTGSGQAKAGGSGNVLVGYGTSEAPARRRRVRPDRPTATGTAGRTNDRARLAEPVDGPVDGPMDVRADGPMDGPLDGPVPVISPLVRRLARLNDLDLRELTGSGPDGLILRADVEDALRASAARRGGRTTGAETATGRVPATTASPATTAAQASAAPSSASRPGGVRTPLKGVRGAVADKLSRSRREILDATCWVDADATGLMRARTAMNASGGPKISLVALLARICTAALARFPELNASVDTEAREVVQYDRVHLGFAAQTDRGLVVPVVRDAHARDAEGLTAEFARLTEAARAGRLTPGELTGGTFTLNNYGVFGVDGSTPIINHPEAAMLGVGRIVAKPWVHEGELAVRQVVQLSLTFDHRVCDGGTAGGFLRYVADCVEQPAVLLRTL